MATILEALKGINAYPIPPNTLEEVCLRREVVPEACVTVDDLKSRAFNLCRADLLLWLSYAPNVSQGGQSYSFTDEQRQQFRNEAQQLYEEFKEEDIIPKTIYGYKGDRL